MCVWYWFIFLPYVCPCLKKILLFGDIVNFVTKTSRDIGGACGNGAIGYRRI